MNTNATATVSSYLDKRVHRLESSLEELRGARQSLFKAKAENDNTSSPLPAKQLQDRTAIALNTIRELLTKLRVHKRQRRTIEADIEEDAEVIKMELARINGDLDQNTPADIDIYELAYANALKTRIPTMSETPPLPTKQERAEFLNDVLKWYNAVDYIDPNPEFRREYCHLTGWWDTGKVVATQLVPATLAGDGVPLHFGVSEMPTLSNDPMNAILLHKNIAGALGKGLIAIFPVRDGDNSGDEGMWECILVDKNISEEVAVTRLYHTSDIKEVNVQSTLWKDLNTLKFNNDNRPAKRYLYFRFMITYFKAKMEGCTEFTSAVEEKVGFWKAPGQYLERSTLKALARNFSGLELSESVIEGQTFVDETVDDAEREKASEILADKLREFFENVEVDGDEDSEEEDDEEEED